MKTIYTFLIIICLATISVGQQIPNMANFVLQPSLFNPARMGADQDFIGVIYRQQFLSLEKKYAPRTMILNTDLSKTLGLSDRLGIGINLMSDKIHLLNRTNVNGFISYHLTPQNSEHHFSAGISAGYLSQKMNFSDIKISDPTGVDMVILNNTQSTGGFDGGFGIHYSFQNSLNIDLASPQLFTSDLKFPDEAEFNHLPHLLAAVSYKIEASNIMVTPQLLYGGMFGAEKNKSYLDLNLQLGFLENQFWIGGGFRPEASAFIASIGANFSGVQLSGTYESHTALGGTIEVGAKYNFGGSSQVTDDYVNGKDVLTPTTPEVTGRDISILNREFTKQKYRSSNATASIKKLEKEINSILKLAESEFQNAQSSTSKEARVFKVKKIKDYLAQAEPKLQNIEMNLSTIENARLEASKIINEVEQRNLKIRKSSKTNNQINKEYISAKPKVATIKNRYESLSNNLNAFEKQYGLLGVDLNKMIQVKDFVGLKNYYQKEIDEMIVKPRNVSPVKIEDVSNSIILTYQYPNDEEKYNLDQDLKEAKLITTHIVSKINEIQRQGLNIEAITISADLAISQTLLQYNEITTYLGEYGNVHSISLKTMDEESKTTVPKKDLTIKKGTINMEKLIALKLYGMKNYLKRYMDNKDILVNLELTSGVYDQGFTQLFSIEIRIKK